MLLVARQDCHASIVVLFRAMGFHTPRVVKDRRSYIRICQTLDTAIVELGHHLCIVILELTDAL